MNSLHRLSVASGLGLAALFSQATQAATIFAEDFGAGAAGNTPISVIGWVNDIYTQDNRVFANAQGITGNNAVYSYANANGSEAFYTTSSMSGGFSSFAINSFTDLTFAVEIDSGFGASTTNARFIVQIDSGSWYASATLLGNPAATPGEKTLVFDPAASNWIALTVTGVGATNSPATLGATAAADLSGSITGVGVLGVHAGNGTVNFDNYLITGTAAIPEPSASVALGGVAALGMVAFRRRRATQAK